MKTNYRNKRRYIKNECNVFYKLYFAEYIYRSSHKKYGTVQRSEKIYHKRQMVQENDAPTASFLSSMVNSYLLTLY